MSRSGVRLLADIGGTRARFALLSADDTLGVPLVLATAEHEGFGAALDEFRARTGFAGRFEAAAVCVAAPLDDGDIRLTNSHWVISRARLAEATGVADPLLINDFTAVAMSLTRLDDTDVRLLGGGRPRAGAPAAVIGPGTGLGVSALIPDARGGHVALASEGGHVTLAPGDESELEVVAGLLTRFAHVSAERVLSGPGLEVLHEVLAEISGESPVPAHDAETIARLARAGDSPVAARSVEMFTRWLGAVAGDLALTIGARGGVYIAGGIVSAWEDMFDSRLFRRGFEDKGRYRAYLESIPTWLITHSHPAFKGLAAMLRDENLRRSVT